MSSGRHSMQNLPLVSPSTVAIALLVIGCSLDLCLAQVRSLAASRPAAARPCSSLAFRWCCRLYMTLSQLPSCDTGPTILRQIVKHRCANFAWLPHVSPHSTAAAMQRRRARAAVCAGCRSAGAWQGCCRRRRAAGARQEPTPWVARCAGCRLFPAVFSTRSDTLSTCTRCTLRYVMSLSADCGGPCCDVCQQT